MAKKQSQAGNGGNGGGNAPLARAPEGMARIGSVANAPWFNLRNGNVLYGKLINVFERPDERSKTGKSKFFQVETMEYSDPVTGEVIACEVREGRGDDAATANVEPGTIVNLNYGPKTKDLEPFVKEILQGAEYVVCCIVNGEKFKIKNGQTMWPVETFAKQTKAATPLDEPDFEDATPEAEAGSEGAQASA
jgi:hypothetical protein